MKNPKSERIKIKITKYANKFTIFILFLIILSKVLQAPVLAEETDYPYEESEDLPPGLVPYNFLSLDIEVIVESIRYVFQHLPEVISYTMLHPRKAFGYYSAFIWKIYASQAWEFASNRSYIEIGYGETVNVHIGRVNMTKLEETEFRNISLQDFMESVSFRFLTDKTPGDFNESWFVYYDPPLLRLDTENTKGYYNINVSISLNRPPIGDQAIQNGILRIKQIPTQQYDSFWNFITRRIEQEKEALPILAFQYSRLFGRLVSGTTSSPKYENMRFVDIIVKVKPYHKVSLDTAKYHSFTPNQVAAVPITVTNQGNYKDTIGFKIVSTNEQITLVDPVDVTLRPGEKKDTFLGIAVSPNLFEIGTLHDIKIQAYSIEDPENIIDEKIIILKTEGFYVSEFYISVIGGIILLLIIIYIYNNSRRRKSFQRYYIPPEKPWDIQKEKENLEKIKKKDKEQYKQTLQMMQEEYLSAMQWYKDHKQHIDRQLMKQKIEKQEKIKKEKIKEKQKKSKKKEEKTVKPIKEKTKIKEEPKEEIKESAKPPKPIKKDISTIEKEKAIQRIIRSQEKQRRKTGFKEDLDQ